MEILKSENRPHAVEKENIFKYLGINTKIIGICKIKQ